MSDIDILSPEARAVGAAWFGMMRHADPDSYLRFGMVESRPSPQAQNGLDELVLGGWITRTNEPSGAVTYRPARDCSIFWHRMVRRGIKEGMNFPLTERIAPAPR